MESKSYEDYENEYQSYLSRIRTILADSSQRRNRTTLQQCDLLLVHAKECVTAMQAMSEIDDMNHNTHRRMESQLLLQRDINPLSKEIQRILISLQQEQEQSSSVTGNSTTQNRTSWFSSSPFTSHPHVTDPVTSITTTSNSSSNSSHFNVESGGDDNNNTMLDALIQNSDELLRESQSILYETESIGNSTIQQLAQQREQLLHTNTTLHQLRSIMISSKHIITSMSRRACRNRFILYIMIGTLVSLNLFVLYWIYDTKYAHHKNTSDHSNDTPNF